MPPLDVCTQVEIGELVHLFGQPDVYKLTARGSVKGLIRGLRQGKDARYRCGCARALGRVGDARAVEPLIGALRDDADPQVRACVAETLGQIGDARAVDPLVGAISDSDKQVRLPASRALGRLGDARAVDPLSGALRDETNANVRACVAETLGQIGDTRAVDPLIDALVDADSQVRRSAAEALDRLAWSPDRGAAGGAYWAAREQWARSVQIGAPAVETLITLLTTAGWGVRRSAAEALGQIGDARAVEPLVRAHIDDDVSVAEAAGDALGKIGGPRAVEVLSRTVTYCLSPAALPSYPASADSVRRSAARALGQIGDANAVRPLISALRDPGVRAAAITALGQIGAQAVDLLIGTLRDDDDAHPHARALVAEALGQIGDARAVEPLVAALDDADGVVAAAAVAALKNFNDPRAVKAVRLKQAGG